MMLLRVQMDPNSQIHSFDAFYESSEDEELLCPPRIPPGVTPWSHAGNDLDGRFTATDGNIVFDAKVAFPRSERYPPDANIAWNVYVGAPHVKVTFDMLHTEPLYDFVRLYACSDEESCNDLMGDFNGITDQDAVDQYPAFPCPIIFTGGGFKVTFTTDSDKWTDFVSYHGFALHWESSLTPFPDDGCVMRTAPPGITPWRNSLNRTDGLMKNLSGVINFDWLPVGWTHFLLDRASTYGTSCLRECKWLWSNSLCFRSTVMNSMA